MKLRRTLLFLSILGGCAPLAGLRPASAPMPGRTFEAGGGAAFIGPRPYVIEEWRGTGQLWFTGRAGSWLTLSVVGAFDTEAVAAGFAARADLVRMDRLAGGVEVELGWLWAGVSLPFAVRLFDQTWLYTAPRVGNFGDELLPSIPLGASVRIYDGFALRLEGQLSWADFSAFNRRIHLGLAGAYQW